MSAAKVRTVLIAVLAFAAVVGLGLWEWRWDVAPLKAWGGEHPVLGAAAYVGALAASVVLLPLSSLPLLPFAANMYGVWLTAALSSAGWWLGALAAFAIARFGRRYLERVASLEAIDRLEAKIPQDVGFFGIVILRMVFPVDLVSFALGLLKELRFLPYAVASLIGIIPFAVVWSYAGGALGGGRYLVFAAVAAGMVVAVLLLRRLWRGRRR